MQFYQSKLLKKFPELTHAFTTKQTGNLAFHVNDKPETLLKNHQNLANELNYDLETLVHMKQIHSNIVKIVDKSDNFDNPPICDALITDRFNTPMMVMVADCSPILFYDSKQRAIAVAHAGRAGAFSNIIHNVIDSFKQNFQTKAKDIIVSIGPAICKKCYEINSDIYNEAEKYSLAYACEKKSNRYYLDIRKILHKQLLNEGIVEKNIEIFPICSQCNPNFFSYRKDKQSGRFAGIITLPLS